MIAEGQTHAARAADKIGGENREKRSLLRGKNEALPGRKIRTWSKGQERHRIYRKATTRSLDRRETKELVIVARRKERAQPGRKIRRHVSLACSACERAHRKMFADARPTRVLNMLGGGGLKRASTR